MEKDTIIISNNKDISEELERNFKYNREFEQKALYLGNGAKNYYSRHASCLEEYEEDYDPNTNLQFFNKNIKLKENSNLIIVSLGCGDGRAEKEMLNKLYEEGKKFTYIGIDSSENMINLIKKNYSETKFKKMFLVADMGSETLHKKLRDLVKDYDGRLFTLFGNTLGNIPQSYIADILRNITVKGDKLWLDINITKNLNDINTARIFERYLKYLNNSEDVNFTLMPLKNIGFPLENGELILNMEKEQSLKALNFKFIFLVKTFTEITIGSEIFTFLPEEVITMSEIRVYDIDSLINFFEKRKFKFIDKMVFEKISQLILEKT